MSKNHTNLNARSVLEMSDEELVSLYKEGRKEGFHILLSRYQKSIYNFLYKNLYQSESTEEAFQEVFLRVIKSIQDYRPSAKFSTWLYTIARNYCIDQKRKDKFRQHLPLEDVTKEEGTHSLINYLGVDSEAGEMVAAKEIEEHLKRILNELNTEQKEVFLMRESQGLTFEEIAGITGVSMNTVKSRMRYALLAIQKKFIQLGIKLE